MLSSAVLEAEIQGQDKCKNPWQVGELNLALDHLKERIKYISEQLQQALSDFQTASATVGEEDDTLRKTRPYWDERRLVDSRLEALGSQIERLQDRVLSISQEMAVAAGRRKGGASS